MTVRDRLADVVGRTTSRGFVGVYSQAVSYLFLRVCVCVYVRGC